MKGNPQTALSAVCADALNMDDEVFIEKEPERSISGKHGISGKNGTSEVRGEPGLASEIYEWVEAVVTAAIAVILVFTFFIRIVGVDGDSMLQTLQDGNRVVISNLFYTPKCGDIIISTQPTTIHGIDNSKPLIKRVIATGGQTVKINYDTNEVFVDGKLLDEFYINREGEGAGDPMLQLIWDNIMEYKVPEGYLFVMGDNRNGSADSRSQSVGMIEQRYILGRVLFRLYPFSEFGAVD